MSLCLAQHGFFSPKAIGNRIKSKGLQKLRWYCEMCNKQCRDENGFKCHCMSEAHMQQMLLVAENPDIYVDRYSDDFVRAFLAQLKRTKGTTRVAASHFYNEYIADKEHVHMNATRWERLTDVIMYMGKEGHCVVDETPKGWCASSFAPLHPALAARRGRCVRGVSAVCPRCVRGVSAWLWLGDPPGTNAALPSGKAKQSMERGQPADKGHGARKVSCAASRVWQARQS